MELKRTLSLKMQEAGVSPKQISEVLSISIPFVSKWKKKFEAEGFTCLPIQYEGRPSYLSTEERSAIINHLSVQEHYSLLDLVDYIKSNCGVTFKSQQSYYDLLSAGSLSWHKTQKSNPKKDEQAVLTKREAIKKKLDLEREKIEKGELVVLMQDECHLIWGDTCGYTWLRLMFQVCILLQV